MKTRTPRDLAEELRRPFASRSWPIENDDNDNDYRAPLVQAVNFRMTLDGREFLVTVEDITNPILAELLEGRDDS